MLDDLRDSAGFEEEEKDYNYQEAPAPAAAQKQLLGMTPVQRFVIAFMIFMMVCILGSFFLLITETIWLPV
ncbi:MAG TPA: hypothetical protein DEH25_13065 [Chloroflexi bacterium]|nr:hypothetical protein [Chloroflexota bacterium]HBY07997.1 hypothetical protein [Chloroflexota bacterium]